MKTKIRAQGFTLIELIIYMGLLAVFMVIMTDLLSSILDVRTQSTAQSFVTSDGDYLRHRLEYDVRRATAITTPATNGTTSTTLGLTIGGSTTTFSVSGTDFLRTVGGVSDILTTSDVKISSFSATRVGNGTGRDTVKVLYTLTSKRTAHNLPAEEKSFALTIGVR